MRVLVTGSAVHLGEALVRTLLGEHEVIGLDIVGSKFTTVVGTIVDRKTVERCTDGMSSSTPQRFINLMSRPILEIYWFTIKRPDTVNERRSLMFSEKEIAYLKSQRLARIATASEVLQPDVAPVGFDFDGTYFYVGGLNLPKTLKYKNIQKNPRAALVIDDVEDINQWKTRGIKIHGIADFTTRQGYVGGGIYIRIKPKEK
jgi:pyridoxamine 5'-phosphate oxidase family protein